METHHVTPEAMAEIVDAVWQQLLALPISTTMAVTPDDVTPDLSVCVHITGECNGAVLLWSSDQFAAKAAAVLFGLAPADVTPADIQDGMAELGNIVAGNIKSLLPGPSALSLPTVTRGADHEIFVRRTRLVAQLPFACEGDALSVLLLEGITPEKAIVAPRG